MLTPEAEEQPAMDAERRQQGAAIPTRQRERAGARTLTCTHVVFLRPRAPVSSGALCGSTEGRVHITV